MAIVQDPAEASFPDMPRNAMAVVRPDYCAPVSKISLLLKRLVHEPIKRQAMKRVKDKGMRPESKRIKSAHSTKIDMGLPSGFVCPECSGPLWEIKNGNTVLYRCLVGHAYAPDNLSAAKSEDLERSLWVALRALEERVELERKLAERSRSQNHHLNAQQFLAKSRANAKHARVIRKVLDDL
jgi:two-component system chemotaxis response regulator CheB